MFREIVEMLVRAGFIQTARQGASGSDIQPAFVLAIVAAVFAAGAGAWVLAKVTAQPPHYYVDESDMGRGGCLLIAFLVVALIVSALALWSWRYLFR